MPRIFDQQRREPDLEIMGPELHLFVDVVVSHPSAPSRPSLEPLAVTRGAESAKKVKYGQVALNHNAELFAFALESYGAFGRQATEVKRLRAGAAGSAFRSMPSTVTSAPFAAQALSVALQRGNVDMANSGALAARLQAPRWGGLA